MILDRHPAVSMATTGRTTSSAEFLLASDPGTTMARATMAAAITAEGTTDEATMGVVDMAPDTDTIIDRDTATVAVMAADTTAGITAGAVAGTATVDITAGAAVITDSAGGTVAGAVATAEAVDMAAVTGDTAKFPAPRSFWRSEIVSSFRAGSVGSSLFRIF